MPSITARKLRSNLTDAEQMLWHHLRRKQLAGLRFRRQSPIGPYVVDFYCHEARLVVELDGGQHAEASEKDAARTRELENLGLRVIRFWNNEVFENLEGMLDKIRQEGCIFPPP